VSQRKKKPHGDPRKAGGAYAGPGGPFDRHAVVVDATDAVLLANVGVTVIEPYLDSRPKLPAVGLELSGRINKTGEVARILFLMDADGAAAIVSELLGLAQRAAGILPDFLPRLLARIDELPEDTDGQD
jgi:hypothetical protein